jgi:fructose-1,6-bisphosphatase/inositol monophosphatase family enzyme
MTLEAPAAGDRLATGDRFAADVQFAREVAERAGRLLVERYQRVGRVDHKRSRDIVTEVDHLSEDLILDEIRRRFPGDAILAEESGAHPAVDRGAPPARVARTGAGEPGEGQATVAPRGKEHAVEVPPELARGRTWVVDPLDGTINYANGIPFFCVSVGLVVDGRPAAGSVHDPMRGETYWATADGPAGLGPDPLRIPDREQLGDYVVSLALGGRAVASRVRRIRRAIRVSRSMGSAALALAYVANGRFDAFIQSAGMSAWDVAAAALIAERAGALVTDMTGGPWFEVRRATRSFGVLAAPPSRHAELLDLSRETP